MSERSQLTIATLVTGALLISNAQRAEAKSEFRQFREQNGGIDRHLARQLFNQQNKAAQHQLRPNANFASGQNQGSAAAGQQALNRSQIHFRSDAHLQRHIQRMVDHGKAVQLADSDSIIRLNSGLDLDLTSTDQSIVLGDNLLKAAGSVQVQVGDEVKTFKSGSTVTAAEYIAVKQVLSGAGQSLLISNSGSASGGSVSFDTITGDHNGLRASSLVVPTGVTTSGDFSKGSDFRLTGDLNNFGTVLVDSANRNARVFVHADDISNASGALISATGDLALGAEKSISNAGTISALGSLSLSAPSIKNSGLIKSSNGNIDLNGPADAALNIDNAGGTIEAANGAINIRGGYEGTFDTNIVGGNLLSKDLNLNAGNGSMWVDVQNVTGVLNQTGFVSHVSTVTDNLILGDICLTGDPTFKNAGNITIIGNVSATEDLAIIASGNIFCGTTGVTISAGNATSGCPITIIAGAELVAGGINSSQLPGGNSSAATLTGKGSATGGDISFTGAGMSINSRSAGKKGSGGDIFIAAFDQVGGGTTGRVDISTVSIFSGGRSKKDANGGVRITSGSVVDNVFFIGNVDTTGGNTTSGSISIITAQPNSSNGANVVFDTTGKITSGNFITQGSGIAVTPADITIKGNVVSNSTITMKASDDLVLSGAATIISKEANLDLFASGDILDSSTSALQSEGEMRLAVTNGNIGKFGSPIDILSFGSLVLLANTGGAFINSPNDLVFNNPISLPGSLFINSKQDITVNSSLKADGVVLATLGGDVTVSSGGTVEANTDLASITTGDGNISIFGNFSSKGKDVFINTSGGNTRIGAGVSVLAATAINIINNGTEKANKIQIDKNAIVRTNAALDGPITIRRGPLGAVNLVDPKFVLITESGGATVKFHGQPIKTKKPDNKLTAQGANVVIGTDVKNKLILGGNVTIFADPPVPSGAPVTVRTGSSKHGHGKTLQLADNGDVLNANKGLDLDLTSSDQSIVVGSNLLTDGASVEISVGGEVKTVTNGSHVTAAEYIAVKQVLSGEGQSLVLGANGSATGGNVSFDSITGDHNGMRASSLVVPVGVTTSGDFTRGSDFRLTGDLNNFGTVLVDSAKNNAKVFVQADDIFNAGSALISATGDLALGAEKSITNAGTISAQGSLSLYAPSMKNSGHLASSHGNVYLNGPSDAELLIDNTGGTIEASNGAISIRDGYTGTFNTYIGGGDLLSKELNSNSGKADTIIDVEELTGTVNQVGNAAHISASTDNLMLGSICLDGDPTYKNDNGDITINVDVIVNADLAIIASGTIISNQPTLLILAGDTTQGHNITIIAGAAQVATGGDTNALPPFITSGTTITGASATGGLISFNGDTVIASRSIGKSGSGGNITLAAYEGTNPLSGSINLDTTFLQSGGRKTKDVNGNVQILAGNTTQGTAMTIGDIDTTGGGKGGGLVFAQNSQPKSSDNQNIVFNNAGQITSGNFIVASGFAGVSAANINVSGIVLASNDILLGAANNINMFTNSKLIATDNSIGLLANKGGYSFIDNTPLFQANLVALDSFGDVGSFANRVQVDAEFLDIQGTDRNVFIGAPNGGFQTIAPITAGAAGAVEIVTNGDLVIDSTISGKTMFIQALQGDITVTTAGKVTSNFNQLGLTVSNGRLNMLGNLDGGAGGVAIGVSGGNILVGKGAKIEADTIIGIQNNATKNSHKITFDEGSFVGTPGGNPGTVTIRVGPLQATPQPTPPKFTTITEVGTGNVILLGGKIKGKNSKTLGFNQLKALDGDLTLSTVKNNKIVLGGGVTLLADPPVPEDAPVRVTMGSPSHKHATASMLLSSDDTQQDSPLTISSSIETKVLSAELGTISDTSDNRLNNMLGIGSLQTNQAGTSFDDSYYLDNKPSAVRQHAKISSELNLASLNGQVARYEHEDGAVLSNDAVVFAPSEDTIVDTPKGKVKIAADSVVLVISSEEALSVYDLHDSHKAGVSIETDGKSIELAPGRHVTVTAGDARQFSDVNPIEPVAHKNLATTGTGANSVFSSEFHIPSLISNTRALDSIFKGKGDEKKISDRIIKTTAVVMHLSGNKGRYEHHVKTRKLALAGSR